MNMDRYKIQFWDRQVNRMFTLEEIEAKGGNLTSSLLDCGLIPRQCTGLKDSEGKLIYEGDVVEGVSFKDPIKREVQTTIRGVVVWTDSYGSPRMELSAKLPKGYKTYPNLLTCKILGNRFENPELLEADEK